MQLISQTTSCELYISLATRALEISSSKVISATKFLIDSSHSYFLACTLNKLGLNLLENAIVVSHNDVSRTWLHSPNSHLAILGSLEIDCSLLTSPLMWTSWGKIPDNIEHVTFIGEDDRDGTSWTTSPEYGYTTPIEFTCNYVRFFTNGL